MFHTSERAFGFPYRVIRTPEGSGLPGRTSGAGLAGRSHVQLREADDLGRVAQDGELCAHRYIPRPTVAVRVQERTIRSRVPLSMRARADIVPIDTCGGRRRVIARSVARRRRR